jgi:hypothetical protein
MVCRRPSPASGGLVAGSTGHVPALSGPLATLPGTSRVRLPSASPTCCDRPAVTVSHLHSDEQHLTAHPTVAPAGVLAANWPAGLASDGPGSPAAADDIAGPAQDGVRADQPQPVAAGFRYHGKQRRDQGPVRPVQPRAARLPSLQDGELVTQDQDLCGLPCLLTPGRAAATPLVAWSGGT